MSALPETVLHASVQGAVLTVIVLVTFAAIPRVPAHVRAWVWWLVTARLVWALLPVPSLEIPLPLAVPSWLPGEVASRVAPAFESARGAPPGLPVAASVDGTVRIDAAQSLGDHRRAGAARAVSQGAGAHDVPLPTIAWTDVVGGAVVLLYVAGLGWQVWRTGRQWGRLLSMAGEAAGAPPAVREPVDRLSDRMDIAPPDVLVHRAVRSPMVLNTRPPALLLPQAIDRWPAHERDLALAHELAHIRRRDLLAAWVPAFVERVFFFDPFARLAVREYALAREAAWDAEAIRVLGCTPRAYGRLLLRLGCASGVPLPAAAVAASTFTTLERRLAMLSHVSATPARRWWSLVPLAAIGLLPITVTAAAPGVILPTPHAAAHAARTHDGTAVSATVAALDPQQATTRTSPDARTTPEPPEPPAPPAPPPPGATPPAPPAPPPSDAAPPVPPAPPTPPAVTSDGTPAPPDVPDAPAPASRSRRAPAPSVAPRPAPDATPRLAPRPSPRPEDHPARQPGHAPQAPTPSPSPAPVVTPAPAASDVPWVLFNEGHAEPAIVAGDDAAVDEARRARRGTEAMVWFRLDGRAYVSRDASLLARLGTTDAAARAAAARLSARLAEEAAHRVRLVQTVTATTAGDAGLVEEHAARLARLAADLGAMQRQVDGEQVPDSEVRQRLAEAQEEIAQAREQLERMRTHHAATVARLRAEAEARRVEGQQARTYRAIITSSRRAAGSDVPAHLREAVRSGRATPVP